MRPSVPAGLTRQPTYGVTISAVCTFCQRPASDSYALTCRGDEWERLVVPVCGRCLALLRRAGNRGRRLKGTRETWWLGHGNGMYTAAHER